MRDSTSDDAMDEFRTRINWSAPDAHEQANRLTKKLASRVCKQYDQGGNAALGTYRDKNNPAAVERAFQSLSAGRKRFPSIFPNFILSADYPSA